MQQLQNTIKIGHHEPTKILVESNPLREATKLSITKNTTINISWEDIQGLTWIFDRGKN